MAVKGKGREGKGREMCWRGLTTTHSQKLSSFSTQPFNIVTTTSTSPSTYVACCASISSVCASLPSARRCFLCDARTDAGEREGDKQGNRRVSCAVTRVCVCVCVCVSLSLDLSLDLSTSRPLDLSCSGCPCSGVLLMSCKGSVGGDFFCLILLGRQCGQTPIEEPFTF